jgi:hypothetical protein
MAATESTPCPPTPARITSHFIGVIFAFLSSYFKIDKRKKMSYQNIQKMFYSPEDCPSMEGCPPYGGLDTIFVFM